MAQLELNWREPVLKRKLSELEFFACIHDRIFVHSAFSYSYSNNEDEIVDYFTQRFASTSAAERFGEGEEMSDEITQQGLLPGVK